MIQIAICDDHLETTNVIEDIIYHYDKKMFTTTIFESGKELVEYLNSADESFQIYFLDIEMPLVNGIETARKIRTRDKAAVIIFVTDYENYVYDVFEVLPFRFIRKPITESAICSALKHAADHLNIAGQIFFFHIGHDKYQVQYKEILYFESSGRKIMIHTDKEVYEFYGKLSTIEKQITPALFTRTHASYLINMEEIRSIRLDSIALKNNTVLPISKRYRKEVKNQHLNFIERRHLQ